MILLFRNVLCMADWTNSKVCLDSAGIEQCEGETTAAAQGSSMGPEVSSSEPFSASSVEPVQPTAAAAVASASMPAPLGSSSSSAVSLQPSATAAASASLECMR